ncbi:MAG TPA: hypothetical protein VFS21_03105 [Roseiflexaceae bacterium]|nr:hypothetical protein [Roseiflexaceae bacterium]
MATNGHGGRRAGAGRPRNTAKYATQIESATDQIVASLPDHIAMLELLAQGNLEVVHEVWELAGLITVDDVEIDKDGRVIKVKRLAFPEKRPDEWVLIQKRVVRNGPSETALIYLVDRAMGKPAVAIEADVGIRAPDIGAEERAAAEREMQAWRSQNSEQLSSLLNVILIPPTSQTST